MISHTENNFKLGVFVISALVLTIIGFYMIGKNRSLFGHNFELKANFSNLNGLTKGNNVLYSGIQAGTVRKITLINDTTIQISMLIDEDLKPFIHKNSLVSIGTEGLMGNKIAQITPVKGIAPAVADGDLLKAKKSVVIDELFQTLAHTNDNISEISEQLKISVVQLNKSELWKVLNDKAIAAQLRTTLANINSASANANGTTRNINRIIDTTLASGFSHVMERLTSASDHADEITFQLNDLAQVLNSDLKNGSGLIGSLLRDSAMVKKLDASLLNIEKGTDGFNQNMEALKHNFLLRGYFKKLEKEKKKNIGKKPL